MKHAVFDDDQYVALATAALEFIIVKNLQTVLMVQDAHVEDITQILVLTLDAVNFVTIGFDGFLKLWGPECEMLSEIEYEGV